jgi:hypothetical protein
MSNFLFRAAERVSARSPRSKSPYHLSGDAEAVLSEAYMMAKEELDDLLVELELSRAEISMLEVEIGRVEAEIERGAEPGT